MCTPLAVASAFTGSFVSTASTSSTFSLILSSDCALQEVGDLRDAERLSRLCCKTAARLVCIRCEHAEDALGLMQLVAEALVWEKLLQVTGREAIVSCFGVCTSCSC